MHTKNANFSLPSLLDTPRAPCRWNGATFGGAGSAGTGVEGCAVSEILWFCVGVP